MARVRTFSGQPATGGAWRWRWLDSAERANTWVSVYILAGIAAADAICCRALGRHAQGDNHAEAVAMVRSVQPDGGELALALGALLGMKTKAGYGQEPVSAHDKVRAPRRAGQQKSAQTE